MFSNFGKFSSWERRFAWVLFCECCLFLWGNPVTYQAEVTGEYKYRELDVCGWQVKIREELESESENAEQMQEALVQLREQLQEVERIVPKEAVRKLKQVVLWFSPEYDGTPPRAEYHPGAEWLRENGRDPKMVRGVEFTNVKVFRQERKRMPNFVLHELAHAFHHQVLENGFDNPQIRQLYLKAKEGGAYDQVEQRFGDGRSKMVRAYGMNNPAEYFAEGTEAYFTTNDFYPFDRSQLRKHDPGLEEALGQLWGKDTSTE